MPVQERRQHPRRLVAVAVKLRHEASKREYPARSVDLSGGGVQLRAPLSAPIKAGHRVEVTFVDAPSRSLGATVVRAERVIAAGELVVGLKFADCPA